MESDKFRLPSSLSPLGETADCSSAPLECILEPEYSHYLGDTLEGKYRYVLQEELAHGGFGKVYLADCIAPEGDASQDIPKRVAIKVFRIPRIQTVGNIVKRELSGILAFRHKLIPKVFDYSLEGSPFVVFEYFERGSLQRLLFNDIRLDWDEAWKLLQNLLSVAAAAHRACILHLDIKPANVLLDAERGFMLADFGISQGILVTHDIVPTGLGAPLFSAPEQLQAGPKSVDTRADLWGIGITCWTAITGESGKRMMELRQDAEGPYGLPPMRTVRPDCPAELDQIVMSLLVLDPDQRPGSAAEVLAYTEAIMNGSPNPENLFLVNGAWVPSPEQIGELVDSLVDPLWYSICSSPMTQRHIVRFDDGQVMCREGDLSYHAFVLLHGSVKVTKNGALFSVQDREGTFLGEITALTGGQRTATMEATGDVWALVLNAAQLEKFIQQHPAATMRLIKSLAERCSFALS